MRRSGNSGLFVSLYNWHNPKTNTSGGAPYGITWKEIGSRFAGSKSELISGALSSAVKFCRMIFSVFAFSAIPVFPGQ
jgi:hypothetical protein